MKTAQVRKESLMNHDEFANRQEPVREDMALQRRFWRFERVGWLALLMLIALALAGLFSKGPLSHVQARTADARLQVEYERFSRNGAQEDLVISTHSAPGRIHYVVMGGELLRGYSIETMYPLPAPSRSRGQDLLVPLQADAQGLATLYLTLRSNGVGRYRGVIGLQDGPALDIGKFIYP